MAYAGVIAFAVIAVIMIVMYRLTGVIAVISLAGQMGLAIAAVSGYFTTISSFTMTLLVLQVLFFQSVWALTVT